MNILRMLVIFPILLGLTACGLDDSPGYSSVNSDRIIIKNGTVLDGRGLEPIRNGVVVIEGDRIKYVGNAADYSQFADAQVIDARGGTILPGIIDAHVHSASDPVTRRKSLMSGVTSICDLGSPIDEMPRFDQDLLGQEPVARGFHSGPIITALGGLPDAVLHIDYNYEVRTPDEAREAVVDLHNHGADFIKVYLHEENNGIIYPMLGEDELAAVVDEAHSLGLLVRAHVTYATLFDMAVQAGVDTIEHVPVNATQSESQRKSESQWQAYFKTQLEKMVGSGIAMVPTLDLPHGELYRAANPTREQESAIGIILGIVRGFHELGGDIGLGTDYNINNDQQSGMPVGEMEMLLAAGLTPMEVIEAGTRISANVCGHGGELGTLEPGKLADVIVVEGDPLADIKAMNKVVVVIKNGEVVSFH